MREIRWHKNKFQVQIQIDQCQSFLTHKGVTAEHFVSTTSILKQTYHKKLAVVELHEKELWNKNTRNRLVARDSENNNSNSGSRLIEKPG